MDRLDGPHVGDPARLACLAPSLHLIASRKAASAPAIPTSFSMILLLLLAQSRPHRPFKHAEIGKMEYVGYNGDYTMLYSNSLTGQLPTEMGQLTALSHYLRWQSNSVSTRTVYPPNPAGNRDDAHRCERYLAKADQPHTQP